MLVPARFDLANPVVTPPPDDCAVPALLVPGAGGEASLDEFPAPLESPPGLAGPEGTPLTPDVRAPAEPALGEPAVLLPADGPLVLCASEMTGDIKSPLWRWLQTLSSWEISFSNQRQRPDPCSCRNDFRRGSLHQRPLDAWS